MKTILLSEGDPTSINYELLFGSILQLKRIAKTHRIILVRGNHSINCDGFTQVAEAPTMAGLFSLTYDIISKIEGKSLRLGKPNEISGNISYRSLLNSIDLQKRISSANLITLPLSKEWVIKSGVTNFRGHTETLAEKYHTPTFMMMTGKSLKVIPLTTHVPIQKVSEELSRVQWTSLIAAIRNSKLLRKPKIGLLGLNPHAGEGGKIGREEIDILLPVMEIFKEAKFQIVGPIPGDSAFLPQAPIYDLILCCYHDQGLIPFKIIEGKAGVNVTLGLDFIRVSPDHGTAFDIAGKKTADPTGLQSCLKLLVS